MTEAALKALTTKQQCDNAVTTLERKLKEADTTGQLIALREDIDQILDRRLELMEERNVAA